MITFVGYDKYFDFDEIISLIKSISGLEVPLKDIPQIRINLLLIKEKERGTRGKIL